MRTLLLSSACLTLSLCSCSSPSNTESTVGGLDSVNIARENNISIFRGLYVNGKFISCDNPRIIYTIENKKEALDSLYSLVLPNPYPQQTIFLEVKGSMPENKSKDLLTIDTILRAEPKDQNNTCVPYDYWCRGNEPFWQLEISESQDLIDLHEPLEQRSTHFPYAAPLIEKDKTVYTTSNETGAIMITIRNEFCSDGMSERKYNFSVEVISGGKNLKGCAVSYNEPRE